MTCHGPGMVGITDDMWWHVMTRVDVDSFSWCIGLDCDYIIIYNYRWFSHGYSVGFGGSRLMSALLCFFMFFPFFGLAMPCLEDRIRVLSSESSSSCARWTRRNCSTTARGKRSTPTLSTPSTRAIAPPWPLWPSMWLPSIGTTWLQGRKNISFLLPVSNVQGRVACITKLEWVWRPTLSFASSVPAHHYRAASRSLTVSKQVGNG